MPLRLYQEIIITNSEGKILYFPAINSCDVNDTFDDLTNTAILEIPRNLKFEDRNIYEGENPLIKRGDKIKISAGYYPNLKLIFEGYISKIDNNVPMVLRCEDSMYLLKQKIIKNKTFLNTSLKDVIDYLMEGMNIEYKVSDMKGFDLRINEANITTVLKKLRDGLGIYSFFKGNVLYVGLAYYPDLANEQTFLFEKVIIDNNLEYLKKEDVKIKVKGVLIKSDNTREEISVGDEDGDLRTVFQYGGTIDDLKRTINSFLEQSNYTGYYGSFTTFLEPKVSQGYYAVLNSYKYPERKGTYLIKSVTTSFGVNGGRQEIELERRIA